MSANKTIVKQVKSFRIDPVVQEMLTDYCRMYKVNASKAINDGLIDFLNRDAEKRKAAYEDLMAELDEATKHRHRGKLGDKQ